MGESLTPEELRIAAERLAELRGWQTRDLRKQCELEIRQWMQIQEAIAYAKKRKHNR